MSSLESAQEDLNRVWTFIKKQSVLNIATSLNDEPYCASCYFVFDEKNKLVAFKTKLDSRHAQEALQQKKVAGTILPNQLKRGIVLGIQFQGNLIFPDEKILSFTKRKYYQKYPYAIATKGEIMIVELSFVKMTDSRYGIGKKIIWNQEM